ncbi:MAG: hypothetical protein ACTSWN_10595 [Promethearchaeota archaeon]
MEQDLVQGRITVAYYYTTDPWLYDSLTDNDRLVLMIGYGLYGSLAPVDDERYFLINNDSDLDIEIFVGVVVYELDTSYDVHTLAIFDWADLNARNSEPINVSSTIVDSSCGFNFTCRSGHTYQVWFSNGDTIYDVFVNVTFYPFGQANVRFDTDLEPEPPTDEIRVRAFTYNLWLDYRHQSRSIQSNLFAWIFGLSSAGLGATILTIFFVKRRYR